MRIYAPSPLLAVIYSFTLSFFLFFHSPCSIAG